MTEIKKTSKILPVQSNVLLCSRKTRFDKYGFSKGEIGYALNQFAKTEKKFVAFNQDGTTKYIQLIEEKGDQNSILESCRKAGAQLLSEINKGKFKDVLLIDAEGKGEETIAFAEGMALGNYQFLKYKNDSKKERNSLGTIFVNSAKVPERSVEELQIIINATNEARTLVNEPVVYLTATQLSKEFQRLGKEAGFSVEIFNKSKIEALKMGGLLSVNLGSQLPPTFTIMEWKPKNAKNKKPYVIVGKGVVYDTGGLSLKPTANSMDQMKCDMAGAAAAGCAMSAIAKAKLPLYVVALVPATDNRPGENAYTPGDVVTTMSGITVEVLNTDAEGRMILADALHYAKKYRPELVLDLATLTGAAVAAIGKHGIAAMGTASVKHMSQLKASGDKVFERIAELPFWEDYGELIKSSVADIKNVGGPYAGAITAGKFLEKFIDYPWIHLDIAGPAFHTTPENYNPYGGTGVGVRLLFDFFKSISR